MLNRTDREALEQVELADRLGIDYAWEVEHHFLEEYSHSSAPEVFWRRARNAQSAYVLVTASCSCHRATIIPLGSLNALRRSIWSRTGKSNSKPVNPLDPRIGRLSCRRR